jgi:acyl-coenzyme A synthetase/AMP-(fatty) acid ligase
VEIERAAASDDSVFQKEVTNAIRQAVSETHEVGLAKLTLLRPGSLPRTTSGKIRRSALKTRLAPSKEIISVSGAL